MIRKVATVGIKYELTAAGQVQIGPAKSVGKADVTIASPVGIVVDFDEPSDPPYVEVEGACEVLLGRKPK